MASTDEDRSRLPMTGRYLTADLPGIGGRIKSQPEDFLVEELPLYDPCGHGEHTYLRIEKRALSTLQAVRAIASELRISPRDIGFAGMKDTQAIARQTISLLHVEPHEVEKLHLPGIEVLWTSRHRNKLRAGHLRGNRFTIRVRNVEREALPLARNILNQLVRRGVPNHYGRQRFGERGNSHLLGRALLLHDDAGFVAEFLGHPRDDEGALTREARAHSDLGDWKGARGMWPPTMADERRALRILCETGNKARAVQSVPKRLRRFLLSAYQSHLFNYVVAARLATLHQVQAGDLAWKHDSGAVFLVDDPEAEQPRAERFEISPSGPMFGYKMRMAEREPGQLESAVLEEEGLALEEFRLPRGLGMEGTRRPLRAPVGDPDAWYEEGLVLRFTLPPGGYATNVLGEIMKPE